MFIMAENNPPPNASPSLRSWALPAANPMQSDRLYNVTQLISPPPEETLRRASRQMPFAPSLLLETPQNSSKRKRRTQPSASLPQQVTPNPKPRKYAKQLAVPESPTRSTFNTIPAEIVISPERVDDAAGLKPRPRSRRSVTPIPPYEPPSVVLTSPREVMAAPTFTNKRKSKSKAHARPSAIKIVPVKKELPDIDLGAPMPPPSPTDDPILLSGPFGPPTSTPSRPRSSQDRAFVPSVSESTQTDDICGQNPFGDILDSEDLPYYDWRPHTRPDTLNTSDSLMDVHPSDADVAPVELPTFNLDDLPPSSDAWSDSDDDNRSEIGQEAMEEGEGEFTGRWRTLLVKTKQDPPSSATRARMEQWGRPVSPFPEEAKSMQILDEEDEEQVHGSLNLEPVLDQDKQDEIDEEEVRRISVEPEGENYTLRPMPSIIETSGRSESGSRVSHTVVESGMKTNGLLDEASDDDNSDQEAESSFVKITSADPRAAARAAAILKLYDYDCFTQITKSKRRRSVPDRMSRYGSSMARRSVSEGRIAKDKAKKRASVGTGVIGSQVFISGAPVTTLRNLLDEVEAEVSFIGPPAKNAYETPIRRRSSLGVFDLSFVSSLSQEGERDWTKDDWKLLDACFTDERFVVGGSLRIGDGLADVEVIDLNHVVDRYISILGGEELVKRFGPGWERDAILQRARALRKKQRSGIVAPPTTPLSLQTLNSAISITPDIPEFTPLPARGIFRRMTRPVLPAPIVVNAPFQDLYDCNNTQPVTPTTFGERVKGFLFSYLPSMSKTAPHPSRKVHTSKPGLPLPPHDLLAKPRGPITTPSRPPLPKAKHPKELVQLHPAPLPAPQASLIPRLKPERLVHLNPTPLPESRASIPIVKPRDSTGSVKDLVRSFEELRKARGGDKTISKPAWKP